MIKKPSAIFKILGKKIFYSELIRLGTYYVYEHALPMGNLRVGDNPEIHPTVSFRFEKNITLGNNLVIDANCCLWASDNSKITLGNNVGVGPGVVMVSSNHAFSAGSVYTEQPIKEKNIIVGNNVWVGANCSILSGAVIGKDSVIGAGCVISRSIPENSVVVSGSRKLSIIERR